MVSLWFPYGWWLVNGGGLMDDFRLCTSWLAQHRSGRGRRFCPRAPVKDPPGTVERSKKDFLGIRIEYYRIV